MMRGQWHKMVYYIGQEQGEIYVLQEDPSELNNLWDQGKHKELKDELLARLLAWLVSSTCYNSGYKRTCSKRYKIRWPCADAPYLHCGSSRPIDRPEDL
jgi:hypothetical protein